MKGSTNSFVFKAAEQGIVSVSVTAPEGVSVAGRTVTAKASGQTTQTKTIPSGATSVDFFLPVGTWTFSVDLPNSFYKMSSKTQTVANEGQYSVTLVIETSVSVYGFRIAIGDSDPDSRVTYPETILDCTNLAYGKTPASGTDETCMNDWAGCELITGIKRQYIDSGSLKFTDITDKRIAKCGSVDDTRLTWEDVFTYVPTWWMKMTNDGTNIDCAFSPVQINDTWKDYAGSVGSNHIGHFRVGCFAGNISSSKLYSTGNVQPFSDRGISEFITCAKNRGTGYDIMTWYQWTYLAALAVLLYKSTNLQAALAAGNVTGTAALNEVALTFSNDYGMYGNRSSWSGTSQMAFFWIQNLWGNKYQFVGGAKVDSNNRLMTCTGYSSASDSDFDKTSLSPSSDSITGFLKSVVGTPEAGFFPKVASNNFSGAMYFADKVNVLPSAYPYVGGKFNVGTGGQSGPFCVNFIKNASSSESGVSSRLSYRL